MANQAQRPTLLEWVRVWSPEEQPGRDELISLDLVHSKTTSNAVAYRRGGSGRASAWCPSHRRCRDRRGRRRHAARAWDRAWRQGRPGIGGWDWCGAASGDRGQAWCGGGLRTAAREGRRGAGRRSGRQGATRCRLLWTSCRAWESVKPRVRRTTEARRSRTGVGAEVVPSSGATVGTGVEPITPVGDGVEPGTPVG